jgi:hypothetical protein
MFAHLKRYITLFSPLILSSFCDVSVVLPPLEIISPEGQFAKTGKIHNFLIDYCMHQ